MKSIDASRTAPSLWQAVLMLLRIRWLTLINGFKRSTMRRKVGTFILALVILGFLGLIFYASWSLLNFLQSSNLNNFFSGAAPILESIPVIIFSSAFAVILVTSFGVLLQALYLAGDMDFLLSSPIPIRAVFISKLLQAILPNFSLICAFALPVLFGLGASNGFNILYYPLVLVIMAALALAAAGISGLMVMAIVRIFPARRVAEILGFIGAVTSFICSQSGQLAQWSNVLPQETSQVFNLLQKINTPLSPLAWAGRGLVHIGEASWLPGAGYLFIALGTTSLIFIIALSVAERLYYTGWASMQHSKKSKKRSSSPARTIRPMPWATFFANRIPASIRAIVKKDSLVLRRDLRNMSQLITPLIFGIIYAVMLLRGGGEPPAGRGDAPEWYMAAMKNLLVYGNVGLSLFVSWMLSARLAGMGFSQEGKHYWLLKSSPVSTTAMIAAKYLVAYLPVIGISWLYVVAMWLLQKAQLSQLLYALPVVALSIAGNTGINLAFGIQGANMTWEDPRQMQKGSSSCLSSLVSIMYFPLALVLFFGPSVLSSILGYSEAVGNIIGLVIGGGFSLACSSVPLWLARTRIPLLGE